MPSHPAAAAHGSGPAARADQNPQAVVRSWFSIDAFQVEHMWYSRLPELLLVALRTRHRPLVVLFVTIAAVCVGRVLVPSNLARVDLAVAGVAVELPGMGKMRESNSSLASVKNDGLRNC